MGELLVTIPWTIYCTWTFKRPIGPDGAAREIQRWISLVAFSFPRGVLGWMIGLEHDLGAEWCHGHGLLVELGRDLEETITLYRGKPHERTVPLIEPYWLAWFRRHGSGQFKTITGDGAGCSFYCAKYSAKQGDVLFSSGLEAFRGAGGPREPLTWFPGGSQ
jgi:hypothetical protein